MLVLAAAAATFAWWWNYNRGRQALDLYGPPAAALIGTAPTVEYVPSIGGDGIDISRAPGLLNARTSLLSDASYEWTSAQTIQDSAYPQVRFSDGGRSVEVAFDFANQTIKTSSTRRIARLTKRTADGWQAYLARQQRAATPAATPRPN